jgi:hypothetical protein
MMTGVERLTHDDTVELREAMTLLAFALMRNGTTAIATDKDLTPKEIQRIYELKRVDNLDPEHVVTKEGEVVEYQEPSDENPVEAVIFKLLQIIEYYRGESNYYMAGDVTFFHNDRLWHRWVRNTRDLSTLHERDRQLLIDQLVAEYEHDFTARWEVAFGLDRVMEPGKIYKPRVVTGTITGKFPGMDEQDVVNKLLLTANTGITLIEQAKEVNVPLVLTYSDGTQRELSHEEAIQLIVAKVPTYEMLERLLEPEEQKMDLLTESVKSELQRPEIQLLLQEIEANPEAWGQVAQAIAYLRQSVS